jgi:hypothetical protein
MFAFDIIMMIFANRATMQKTRPIDEKVRDLVRLRDVTLIYIIPLPVIYQVRLSVLLSYRRESNGVSRTAMNKLYLNLELFDYLFSHVLPIKVDLRVSM